MIEFETKVKKWGNSLGMVIPKRAIEKGQVKEEQTLHIIAIQENKAIKGTFGTVKGLKSGQAIKDMLRKEWDSNVKKSGSILMQFQGILECFSRVL